MEITKMEWSEYESEVASKLELRPFLKWRNKKTLRLVKKLYKLGYSVNDAVNFVVLLS